MNKLDDLLKLWTETQDVEEIISAGFLQDQKAIQADLDKKPDAEKAIALDILSQMSSALSAYINGLDHEKSEVKGQIDNNLKSAKACISYVATTKLDRKE